MTPEETERFWIQTLAQTLSSQLRMKFGVNEYFASQQVLEVCEETNVPEMLRPFAMAMFVDSGECGKILKDLGISKSVDQLRAYLGEKLSFTPEDLALADGSNLFHNYRQSSGSPWTFGGFSGWSAVNCGTGGYV